jgi:hypothetical protein
VTLFYGQVVLNRNSLTPELWPRTPSTKDKLKIEYKRYHFGVFERQGVYTTVAKERREMTSTVEAHIRTMDMRAEETPVAHDMEQEKSDFC